MNRVPRTNVSLTFILLVFVISVNAEDAFGSRSVRLSPRPLGYSSYDYQPDLLGSLLGLGNRLVSPYPPPPYYGYGYGYDGYPGSSPFIGGRPVNPGPSPAYNPPGYQWYQYST